MDRQTLIQHLVLDMISNDYENVDQTILEDVNKYAPEYGVTVTRTDVVAALEQLVAQGLAKAYVVAGTPPLLVPFAGMPALDVVEEDDYKNKNWFIATAKGRHLMASEPAWYPESQPGDSEHG